MKPISFQLTSHMKRTKLIQIDFGLNGEYIWRAVIVPNFKRKNGPFIWHVIWCTVMGIDPGKFSIGLAELSNNKFS